MTKPDEPKHDPGERTYLEEVLDSFKAAQDDADNASVSEPPVTKSRLNWRSVTDTEQPTVPSEETSSRRSGFQFDLGGALSKLGDGRDGPPPPRSVPLTAPQQESAAPALDRRSPASPSDDLQRRARSVPSQQEPELAPLPRRGSAKPAPVAPSTDRVRKVSGRTAPAPVFAGGPTPTLPAAKHAEPPAVAVPIDVVGAAPDLHALRSAQLRATRQQRQGKLFGRTLLTLLGLGGVFVGALFFGRDYLFPTKWNPELTPVVDQIQIASGQEFDHAIPLVVQPADQYASTVSRVVLGDDWLSHVAEWRALGLAAGDPAIDVGTTLAARWRAVYDPVSDTIYRSEGADPATMTAHLRSALEEAFAVQLATVPDPDEPAVAPDVVVRLAGVSSPQVIAERAVDSFLLERQTAGSTAEIYSLALPTPIAYQLAAINELGEAILLHAGVDPDTALASPRSEAISGALAVPGGQQATGVALAPGDIPPAGPAPLGTDDWSLVWDARLPSSTVGQLVAAVTADSYQPFSRSGTTCVSGVFEAANDVDGGFVLAALQEWAAAAPPTSQAIATAITTTRVQLVTCDPGVGALSTLDPSSVDALIRRQLVRLAR